MSTTSLLCQAPLPLNCYQAHIRLNNKIRYLPYRHPSIWQELSEESRKDVEKALDGKTVDDELRSIIRTTGFQVKIGHVASGPVVGASQRFAKWLKANIDRKYVALEMESAGVMNAVYQGAGDVRVLIVRAISDMSDDR